MPFFQLSIPAPEPLNQFCTDFAFAQLVTSATPPHTQTFGSVGSNGVCLRMLEAVIFGHLFLRFSFHAHRYRSTSWTDDRR